MLQIIFIICIVLLLLYLIISEIGSVLYDLNQTKLNNLIKENSNKKALRSRPLVSVVVISNNSEKYIEQCLLSIKISSYRNKEILVLDNASNDESKKIVKKFIINNPKLKIKLIAKRKVELNIDKWLVKKHASSQLVMFIKAESILDKSVIKNAVLKLNSNKDLTTIYFKENIIFNFTLSSFLLLFDKLIDTRTKKLSYIYKINNAPNLVNCLSYLDRINKNSVLYFDDSCLINTNVNKTLINWLINSLQSKLNNIILFMINIVNILIIILISYFLFLAIKMHEPNLLILSFLSVTFVLQLSIWTEKSFSLGQKLLFCISSPITFILYYLKAVFRSFNLSILLIKQINLVDNN